MLPKFSDGPSGGAAYVTAAATHTTANVAAMQRYDGAAATLADLSEHHLEPALERTAAAAAAAAADHGSCTGPPAERWGLAQEAGRCRVVGAPAVEQGRVLPLRDRRWSWLALAYELELLARPLTFDRLHVLHGIAGPGRENEIVRVAQRMPDEVPTRSSAGGGSSHRCCTSSMVMRAGSHYAEFTITGIPRRRALLIGVCQAGFQVETDKEAHKRQTHAFCVGVLRGKLSEATACHSRASASARGRTLGLRAAAWLACRRACAGQQTGTAGRTGRRETGLAFCLTWRSANAVSHCTRTMSGLGVMRSALTGHLPDSGSPGGGYCWCVVTFYDGHSVRIESKPMPEPEPEGEISSDEHSSTAWPNDFPAAWDDEGRGLAISAFSY